MASNHPSLLTAYLFVSRKNSWDGLQEMITNLEESGITVEVYGPQDMLLDINPKHPRIYVSLGLEWEEFQTLNALPLHERKRWLHFDSPVQVQPFKLFYGWLNFTDPLPENRKILSTQFSSDTPLVSVFTASYRSKEKIQRPYRSLLNQTYPHWEWVIVDDSGDEDETYNKCLLSLNDSRIRRYRQDSCTGYIGAVKRYAAGLCTGEILVEVDHDDELTPDCLEKIVRAFQQHPECGFAYGDGAEVYVGSNNAHWYGWDCGYGYSMYYRVWVHEMNRWQNVYKQTAINGNTIGHLVGLPNHPRAWTRDCYHQIGGHREELLVADDYDMLVRTFLCTKYVAIPDLLYIQYRNEGGDNSTFLRNEQIQILCRELENYYHERMYKRVKELNLPDSVPYSRVWETATDDITRKTAHIVHEDRSRVSILFPIPYSYPETEHTELFRTLQQGIDNNFKEIEVVIVGCIPPEIESFASKAPMGAIRWWPMEFDDSLETCIRYAELCASCTEKVIILP
ncbi:glycosyltransferase [Bacillus gaemokensis]|uniref:Glycosyl transferase family 2 n=1 Tax=Bacillus gaemokensis TaxID=574375 RepID=A0A073KL00_9BACI|nr:glycosyltransferase [Bacillus gaemokensis]KEK22988.1 glycosyl transferase family 2 [Bacillus gaemokensis]KYG37458.1 glycosyl transferase family 2 [Bacillus gaemokensis]